MLLNTFIAGFILFFVNSCIVPVHFVGYQFRMRQADQRMILSQYIPELNDSRYLLHTSENCSYYFDRKSAHYITICLRDKNVYFIGTDVRSVDVRPTSDESVLEKIDIDAVMRLQKIQTTLSGLKKDISDPSFVVYQCQDLESDDQLLSDAFF